MPYPTQQTPHKHKTVVSRQQSSFFKNKVSTNTLNNLIDKYMYYLRYEKNVSPKTIENYGLRLSRLVDFLGNIKITELNRMQLLEYRMALNAQGLSVRTINYHIVAIRAFLKFLLKNDIDCISPDKLELAKVQSKGVNFLTEEEITKILDAPTIRNKKPLQKSRDEAILQFLYGTGLRVTELIMLQKKDIKVDSNQFSVVGK